MSILLQLQFNIILEDWGWVALRHIAWTVTPGTTKLERRQFLGCRSTCHEGSGSTDLSKLLCNLVLVLTGRNSVNFSVNIIEHYYFCSLTNRPVTAKGRQNVPRRVYFSLPGTHHSEHVSGVAGSAFASSHPPWVRVIRIISFSVETCWYWYWYIYICICICNVM